MPMRPQKAETVIGRRKIARGRPSGASSRDGGASSRRAAAGFPAISNNLLLERVEQHTVGVSGPPVRSTASAGAALALGATVSRYGGASSRRAAAGFPAISNDLSAERVDQHTVGVCGARVRSTASAGAALAPAPRRRARSETVAARAAGTELQRAAGQRRPCEPLGHGVTAGGPPGGAHIARLGLSAPRSGPLSVARPSPVTNVAAGCWADAERAFWHAQGPKTAIFT